MNYYKLRYDMDKYEKNGIMVHHNDLQGLDIHMVRNGSFIELWDENFSFDFDLSEGDKVTDYICNNLSWFIVSDKFKRAIEYMSITGIQYLPVNIINKNNGERLEDYYVANICNLVDCINMEKSEYIDCGNNIKLFISFVIEEDKIEEKDIFRIKGSNTSIIVSDKIKDIIKVNKLKGFDFEKVEVI